MSGVHLSIVLAASIDKVYFSFVSRSNEKVVGNMLMTINLINGT